MLATLHSVKTENPTVATLFYMNSFMDFQFYDLHERMVDRAALLIDHDTNKTGTVTNDNGMKGITVFDLANPDASQLWLELVAIMGGGEKGGGRDGRGCGGIHVLLRQGDVSQAAAVRAGAAGKGGSRRAQ